MAEIRRAAGNNIYTVLAFVAFLVLAFGVVYVFIRYNNVFGAMPFFGMLDAGGEITRQLPRLA